MTDALNSAAAHAALQANTSGRYRSLDVLDRFVAGTQYEGRASWWDDSGPLFERAPCIVYPVVAAAISSHVALVLGGHRFPVVTTGSDEDDSEFDPDFGLNEDDSRTVDRFICLVGRQARIQRVCRELLTAAMGSSTAVAVPCIRKGRAHVEVIPAKCCEVEFVDGEDGVVKRLEYRFPYIVEERDASGRIECKCYIFRRVIDETSDTTFEPALADERGADPDWAVKASVQHGLGFAPVVWYRFRPKHSGVASIDGDAIHASLLDEVQALDFALSQRHRGTLYCADPILLEIGVEQGYSPTGIVQSSIAFMNPEADRPAADGRVYPADHSSTHRWKTGNARNTGRKRGPGMAYQYPSKDSKVDLLTLPADAMKASSENAADIERKICDSLHWKPIDPKEMLSGGTLSGRALEMLMMPQIEYCEDIHDDFADGCLLPIVDMFLRIVLHAAATGGVYIAGLGKTLPIIQRFMREQQTDIGIISVWMPPDIRAKWPPKFKPTEQDQKALGEIVRADLAAGLIKMSTAVQAISAFYDIEDPAAYADDMERDAEERKKALADATALLNSRMQQQPSVEPEHDDEPSEEAEAATEEE